MAVASAVCTPVNTISRENLKVLIRNNILNDSMEFMRDREAKMEIDSPIRKANFQPISKKLFHSPCDQTPNKTTTQPEVFRRRPNKRKQSLIPDSDEKIKRAYVMECEGDGYSPDACAGMRKRVLISLFHNKEYSMDFS